VYWAKYLHAKGRNSAALNELARRLAASPRDAEALALRREIGDSDGKSNHASATEPELALSKADGNFQDIQ